MTSAKENQKSEVKIMNKLALLALLSTTVLVYIGIFIIAGDIGRTIFSVAAGVTTLFVVIMVFFVKDF